jgi:hypothetical protein
MVSSGDYAAHVPRCHRYYVQPTYHIEEVAMIGLNRGAWTTEAELEFLDGLGGYAGPTAHRLDRLGLLIQYAYSMNRRVDWGAVDAAAVKQACHRMQKQATYGGQQQG